MLLTALARTGDVEAADAACERAISLETGPAVRRFLQRCRAELRGRFLGATAQREADRRRATSASPPSTTSPFTKRSMFADDTARGGCARPRDRRRARRLSRLRKTDLRAISQPCQNAQQEIG